MHESPAAEHAVPLTFLFTDVEGSVRLWAADIDGTAHSFELHDELIRRSIETNQGLVFGTAGDSFRGVFADANNAVLAAQQCQQELNTIDWGSGPALRVRMGINRGLATERDGDFFGPVPNTSARVEALGHGGQILLTAAVTETLAGSAEHENLLWMGEYRLRDVPEPVGIFQLGADRFPALRHVNPTLSSLPNLGSRLIGRQTEVPAIREVLSRHNVVTLTGYGGCGKTRVALEVAHQELPSRPGGCYFVDLSAVVEEDEFPAALAAAARLTLTNADPIEQVLEYFSSRDALVVLDNCEHLVEMCAEFAELFLQRCVAKLLVTSRQRLDIAGEQTVLIQPLGHQSVDSPAVALFLERATAVNNELEASGSSLQAIQEICTRLDGIPLAIELAAARVAILSPAEILERMEDRFRLLSGGRHRRKRRTLEATLDWSYGLLGADEQQLFRRCGVFSGTFSLDAATAVSALDPYLTMDLLQSLVMKSLVSTTTLDGTNRFHLLETVRAYAVERLDDTEELQKARDEHLRHYGKLVRTSSWIEASDIDRSRQLRTDWSNLSAALEWAASNRAWPLAADVALGCQGMWEHHVPAIEGRRWIEQILIGLDGESSERVDRLTLNVAMLAMQLDDFEAMHGYLLPLDESRSPVPAAQAMGYRAFTRIRHNPNEAKALFERTDTLVAQAELGPEAVTPNLWSRGTLALYDARFGDALPLLEKAYQSARSEGSHTTHSVIAGLTYASNLVLLGEPEQTLTFLDTGVWESVWDASPIVRALALIDIGDVSEAADLILDFSHQALLGRLSRMANDALVGFAALAISRDEHDLAWSLLSSAVTPRTPATIVLAEGLADQLGLGDKLRALHRNRDVPLLALDATNALREELVRLSAQFD